MARRNRKHGKFSSNSSVDSKRERGIDHDLNNAEHAIKKDFGRSRDKRDHMDERKDDKSVPRTRYGNDPIWYALNPDLLKDAGALSFNNPTGLPVADVVSMPDGRNSLVIPGISTINYLPGIGLSNDNSSAVNVAARKLYTFVRHMNSGAANYDSPDLMLYCISVASALTTYMQMCRAYGVANVYSQKNRYMPDGILQALGFDPKDVRLNLADFRYHIGVASAKLNSLAVPGNIYYFARQMWLNTGLYFDNPGAKSQIYAFKPLGYFVYDELSAASGQPGKCQFEYYYPSQTGIKTDGTPETLTTHQWYEILNKQLAAVIESEDIGIMAGDLLKAYGPEGLLRVPSIAEDYVVIPQYDEEVLMQINNAQFTNTLPINKNSCSVVQDGATGAIKYGPVFDCGTRSETNWLFDGLRFRKLLNIRSESPTPADVMVATRLTPGGAIWVADSGSQFRLVDAGTEIPVFNLICVNEVTASGLQVRVHNGSALTAGSADDITALAMRVTLLTKFDWHPLAPIWFSSNNIDYKVGIVGDIDNYTTIGEYELSKLNETALLSLFNVPPMAGSYK